MSKFNQAVKNKVLLWCDRHCCLCKRACGTDIEVHHLVQPKYGGGNNIDNAIPLCYDCHAKVLKYNDEHPKGIKYKAQELKPRREQVYEEYTRHLVPLIWWEVTQTNPQKKKRKSSEIRRLRKKDQKPDERRLPDVGFNLAHKGPFLPVRVKVKIEPFLGGRSLGVFKKGHYSGQRGWAMNPGHMTQGHFQLPKVVVKSRKRLEVKVDVIIIDQYEREHKLLQVGYVYMRKWNAWYFNP